MRGEDFILNAVSYVIVIVLGAIGGGLAGLYIGLRLSLSSYRFGDPEPMNSPVLTLVCGTIGASLGAGAIIMFLLVHRQSKSTLPEVHERMGRRRE